MVAVSAHSDDIALSIPCTVALLCTLGLHVTVLTCFSRSLNTTAAISGTIDDISALRKEEDAAFAAHLGASIDLLWLDYDDAPIRGHTNATLLFLPSCVGSSPQMEIVSEQRLSLPDHDLLLRLLGTLATFDSTETCFLFPLSIGGHVDHVILASAGRQLHSQCRAAVLFYEDLPYAGSFTPQIIHDDLHRAVAQYWPDDHLQQIPLHYLNPMDCKEAAANCYPSQVSLRWKALIRRYTSLLIDYCGGAERVWQVGPDKRPSMMLTSVDRING